MRLKEFNKKVHFPNSMVCMCSECHDLYSVRHINFEPDGLWDVGKCPKYGCYGTLVEIDEMIAPMIRDLNKKNYETMFCCSGHPGSEMDFYSYISFKNAPNAPAPSLWFWDKKNPDVLRSHKGNVYLRMYFLEKLVDELEKCEERRLKDGTTN